MDEILLSFHKYFLCASTFTKLIKDSSIWKQFDEEKQKTLLDLTVNHPLQKEYPTRSSYCRSFLKFIIKELERSEVEVCIELYESYLSLLNNIDKEEELHYKHYILPGDQYVTLRESCSLISDGTTGLHTWQASLALAEWCLNHSQLLEGKEVLELGSGAGLTGLTLLLKLPLRYCFTDVHSLVLENLCYNVRLNVNRCNGNITSTNAEVLLKGTVNNNDVEVRELAWEEVSNCHCVPDVILAADVVYDSSIFTALSNAMCHFVNKNKRCSIILASTVRNNETLDKFLTVIGDCGLNVKEEGIIAPSMFVYDEEPPVKIHSLSFLPLQIAEEIL